MDVIKCDRCGKVFTRDELKRPTVYKGLQKFFKKFYTKADEKSIIRLSVLDYSRKFCYDPFDDRKRLIDYYKVIDLCPDCTWALEDWFWRVRREVLDKGALDD